MPPHSGHTCGEEPWWMRWWAAALQLLGSSMGGEHSEHDWKQEKPKRKELSLSPFSKSEKFKFNYLTLFHTRWRLTVLCAGLISWKCSATSSLLQNWAWHSGHLLPVYCTASAFLATEWCAWGAAFGLVWPKSMVLKGWKRQLKHIQKSKQWSGDKKEKHSHTSCCWFLLADHLIHRHWFHDQVWTLHDQASVLVLSGV